MAFDNIKLEKGLYTTGKSFTAALEELDPSENYKGTSLDGLDAYERQLKRFDIKVSGQNSDPISKFFASTDSAALFPEYISRAVKTGYETNSTIENIVATTTEIDSLDYRSIKTVMTDTELNLDYVKEGEALPELEIKTSDKLVKLHKHGKMISASYEAIKYQRLDLFTTVLKQIGNHIANSEFENLLNSIDDKNIVSVNTVTSNIGYTDFITLWLSCQPYQMNTIIASADSAGKIMNINEFKDGSAGFTFQRTGEVVTPLGSTIYVSDIVGNELIAAFDKNYAFEKVQAGGIMTEFDKLIDRQLERATISTLTGFTTIYDEAIKFLNLRS
ncbi:MAG: phage major capsid protein [Clostridium sp.]|nr:phage major capsid protein [Clostridium sp.]